MGQRSCLIKIFMRNKTHFLLPLWGNIHCISLSGLQVVIKHNARLPTVEAPCGGGANRKTSSKECSRCLNQPPVCGSILLELFSLHDWRTNYELKCYEPVTEKRIAELLQCVFERVLCIKFIVYFVSIDRFPWKRLKLHSEPVSKRFSMKYIYFIILNQK